MVDTLRDRFSQLPLRWRLTLWYLLSLGIILLLFEVGLETDIGRLARSGGRSVAVALGGFVVPFVLGYGTSRYLFGHDILLALFIGGTLTATSIGVTAGLRSLEPTVREILGVD